jgi:hypothetical protein
MQFHIRYITTLLESVFLHEVQMASKSSSFPLVGFAALPIGGDVSFATDDDPGRKEKATGMRSFNLPRGMSMNNFRLAFIPHVRPCAGSPPRHVVWTLTSASDRGGPDEVYVGVREGSQKSGSLARRASACSRSIWRNAASSASRVRASTVEESKSNFRFVPRPWIIQPSTRTNRQKATYHPSNPFLTILTETSGLNPADLSRTPVKHVRALPLSLWPVPLRAPASMRQVAASGV